MISANELRIGNWVTESVLGTSEVVAITIHTVGLSNGDTAVYSIDCENISPILLTPEILEKVNYYINGEKGDLIADMINEEEVHNLHQLQNLYFALTGTELETQLL